MPLEGREPVIFDGKRIGFTWADVPEYAKHISFKQTPDLPELAGFAGRWWQIKPFNAEPWRVFLSSDKTQIDRLEDLLDHEDFARIFGDNRGNKFWRENAAKWGGTYVPDDPDLDFTLSVVAEYGLGRPVFWIDTTAQMWPERVSYPDVPALRGHSFSAQFLLESEFFGIAKAQTYAGMRGHEFGVWMPFVSPRVRPGGDKFGIRS